MPIFDTFSASILAIFVTLAAFLPFFPLCFLCLHSWGVIWAAEVGPWGLLFGFIMGGINYLGGGVRGVYPQGKGGLQLVQNRPDQFLVDPLGGGGACRT